MPPSPAPAPAPLAVEDLADKARAYARAARAENTRRAYDADWRCYADWCARRGFPPTPPDPQLIGVYIADLASSPRRAGGHPLSAAAITRRLSGLAWRFRQMGTPLERGDPHIREVLAGVRRRRARPPTRKEALSAADLIAMLGRLGHDLRGLRDRAILLAGFAGGLRRGEIVGLDLGPEQTADGGGWIEIAQGGAIIRLRGKTGWREVEIAPGSSPATCPVAAVRAWLRLGRLAHGPLFRRISRDGRHVLADRLSDKHVARLVRRTALEAGVRGDLPEAERARRFAGHSLRAGLATAAEAEERFVQRQLGHATVEMTRRYQRARDRFRVNLTRAAGL